jgi:hypothetical protein
VQRNRRLLSRPWVVAAGVYLLAVAVRLVFLLQARDNPLYQFLVLDERTQHEVGVAISKGTLPPNGYFKAPLYGYFLGAIYRVAGADPFVARVVQVFVAGLAPVLIFFIARRLFGSAVGLVAGGLTSVYWIFVFFSTELLDATLGCVFCLLLAWLLVGVDDARRWKWPASGITLGLGAITRPNILALAPVLALMIVVAGRRQSHRNAPGRSRVGWVRIGLTRVCLLVAGTALAIAPVTMRNLIVANERLLICAYGGINFFIANNPQSDGKNTVCPKLDITVRHPGLDMNDPAVRWDEGWQACYLYAAQHLGPRPRYDEVERFFYRKTLDYIRQCPAKFAADTFKRFCWLFNAYEYPNNKDKYHFLRFSSLLRALSWLHFGIIGPIGVVGLVMALRRRPWPPGMNYYFAMILSLAVPGIFFVVNARYRLPVVYLLMPAVAYGIVELVRLVRPPVVWRRVAVIGGSLAGLMVFSNLNLFGYRPPHHEYLLFSFAGACGATGQTELMGETVGEIERALADRSYRHTLHPWAMTCLFDYFRQRGDIVRAAHYGWEALQSEPVSIPTLGALADVLIQADRRDRARQCLQTLANRSADQPNPYLAGALLRFGQAYRDRQAVTEAAKVFRALVRLQPQQPELLSGLEAAERLLQNPATQPSSTASP